MDTVNYFLNLMTKPKFIYTLFILIIVVISKWIINRLIISKLDELSSRYKWSKITTYLSFFIGTILILLLWLENFKIGTFLGLSTAGAAIALRDPITNFIAWIFILWKRPFAVGDRIQIGETAGDIIDIRIFQFSLIEIGNWVEAEQSTGRIVHVPNKKLFNYNLANYTSDFPFIWNEIPVLITFESNWKKAKEVLLKTTKVLVSDQIDSARNQIRQSSRKYMIYYGKLTPIIYTRIEESGVSLTIRYLCDPLKRRSTEAKIWEEILNKFSQENNIKFAYPTKRLYFQSSDMQETEEKGKYPSQPDKSNLSEENVEFETDE